MRNAGGDEEKSVGFKEKISLKKRIQANKTCVSNNYRYNQLLSDSDCLGEIQSNGRVVVCDVLSCACSPDPES